VKNEVARGSRCKVLKSIQVTEFHYNLQTRDVATLMVATCNVMAAEWWITISKRISAAFGSKVTESRSTFREHIVD